MAQGAGEFHENVDGLWLPWQNSGSCSVAFGDLYRLGPVAKGFCPSEFVLAPAEDLRGTQEASCQPPGSGRPGCVVRAGLIPPGSSRRAALGLLASASTGRWPQSAVA